MNHPEVLHRIAYGHLNRETWRSRSDLSVHTEPIPLTRILDGDSHASGVIGYAGNPEHSPAIIVHRRPPHQLEVRLRWLAARVDVNGPLRWLYAPDIADMMLDLRSATARYTPAELLAWLKEWAAIQDWGKEPVIREN